jgi:DNA-binding NtrC family response regulator
MCSYGRITDHLEYDDSSQRRRTLLSLTVLCRVPQYGVAVSSSLPYRKGMEPNDQKRILVIEDDSLLIEEMKAEFIKHNFAVDIAMDGETGYEKIFSMKPHLVVLDIAIPKMNGVELLTKLQEDPWGKTIPVVVLTNMGDSANIAQVMELGNYDYLIKSDWALTDLLEKINRKLGI